MAVASFVLEGPVPSKKNSRIKPRNCNFTIPSREYYEWQRYARWQARLAWRRAPTTQEVEVMVITSCRNDADNLAQSVLDAMEGVVYEDDRQVKRMSVVRKPKSGRPYTTVVMVGEVSVRGGQDR